MRNRIIIGLIVMILGLGALPAWASLSETATLPSGAGDGGYAAAVIDTTNEFAYFGSSSGAVGVISAFQLQNGGTPFAAFGSQAPFAFGNNFTAAVFDATTGFGYFASSSSVSGVGLDKIPLTAGATPPTSSSTTLVTSSAPIGAAVLDTANQFGYFGTFASPSNVLKVRLSDLVVVSSITMPAGVNFLSAAVIDVSGGFAYFASSTTPGQVAKIQLSNFSMAGTLSFSAGQGGVGSAFIDVARQLAYFGTHDHPGKIVKVSLTALTQVGSLTLSAGQDDLTSAVEDLSRNFGYFGTNTQPGIVVPVTLSNMNASTALTLASGHDFLRSAVFDPTNEYAYFGTFTTPGLVSQVDVLAGAPTILLQPSNLDAHPGEAASFSISADGRGLTYQWQKNGVAIPGATLTSYAFVANAADDGSTFACVVTGTNGSVTSNTVTLTIIPIIRAFPNPWRVDRHAGTTMTFDGLLNDSTVKIFNLAVHWVKTLPVASGTTTWDLTNDSGEAVGSGYYFFVVTTGNDKQTVRGKIAIIR